MNTLVGSPKQLTSSSFSVQKKVKLYEEENEDENSEKKKEEIIQKLTNIFVGNLDFATMAKNNQQVKVFEGKYCKTFIVVDGPKKEKKLTYR